MPTFEVIIPGNLYRNWPNGKEINLGECFFTQVNSVCEFFVHAEVEAKDREEAQRLGCKKCSDATDLLEFCMNEQVDLKLRHVEVKGVETDSITASMPMFVAGYENAPPTAKQLEAIDKAQAVIEAENDSEKKESLMRAIHWQALGRRETQSKIDRFIKFWIALEILVDGKGKKVVSKVRDHFVSFYPEVDKQRIKDVVGHIYGVRGDIVHHGIRQPEDLVSKLVELENILVALLRARIGLTQKTNFIL